MSRRNAEYAQKALHGLEAIYNLHDRMRMGIEIGDNAHTPVSKPYWKFDTATSAQMMKH